MMMAEPQMYPITTMRILFMRAQLLLQKKKLLNSMKYF